MTSKRWTVSTTAGLLSALTVLSGCGYAPTHAEPPTEARNIEVVREALSRGVGGSDTFYAILADDVHWTVARATGPATYTTRQQFMDGGAKPIVDRLTGPIQSEVHELIAGEDRVVARWRGTATALDGRPYVNEYNWVMTLANERVTRVVAYLDFVELDELITRVPSPETNRDLPAPGS